MPEKRQSPKKAPKTSATRHAGGGTSAKNKTTKPPKPPATAFYVSGPARHMVLATQKPADVEGSRTYASFDAAKKAAIDALVDAIEQAESQLTALKRAESYEQWLDPAAAANDI